MDLLTLHIIHNPDDLKRINQLEKELSNQGIDNYYLWDAVYDERGTYQGINKAHKQIVRWAKENDLPFVTVAEDDLLFFDKGAYEYYLNNEPKEYDLYLSGIFLGEIDENNETKKFTGLSLYRVKNNYYNTFLQAEENEHLDIALSYQGGKFIVCNPFTVRQHNGYSTNEKRFLNYDFMFSQRKIFKFG
jgi:hypothetical protein